MAEEFQTGICGGNWWNMSKSHVLIGGPAGCISTDLGTYGSWLVTDAVDLKPRSCKLQDSISTNINNNNLVSHDSSIVFQDSQMPQQADSDSGGSSVLMDSTLQIMGFGISSSSPSSSSDWTQTLLRGNGRGESYNSMLQEDMNSSALNSSRIQKDWSPKSFTSTGEDSSINGYKAAINQDFTLEQQRLNPLNGSGSCYPSSATLIQSLFEPDPQPQQSLFNDRTINYSSPQNYGTILNELSPSWPKLSPFLKPSLHFSNNTPFWNASATALNEIRADFLPSSQPQFLLPAFEEKPNCPSLTPKPNNEQIRDSGSHVVKKGSEPPLKRTRIETPSPLPTFKVRKEKLGDRITALQQLVSPFGKTDTASVLHEAIGCIKFLHDQVNVLSTPYMKNGNPIQHQQAADKLKESEESKQDLKSRGLCLVPISSTFAVANETTADFWTPTFGGTFR